MLQVMSLWQYGLDVFDNTPGDTCYCSPEIELVRDIFVTLTVDGRDALRAFELSHASKRPYYMR